MPEVVKNEMSERRPSTFLPIENKSKFTLKSHLVKLETAYVKTDRESMWVLHTDDSQLAQYAKRYQPRTEYIYYGLVNGQEGMMRLPSTVFFAIQEQAKILNKEVRDYEWVVSKTGEGLKTKYTVTRLGDVKTPDKEVEANTEKLLSLVTNYEKILEGRMNNLVTELMGAVVQ